MEMDWQAVKAVLREVLEEEMGAGRYDIAPRYKGGTVVLKPADDGQKPKEIPMEVFWKKITSVREKLRVLEQKVNSNKSMSAEERAELQLYITRAYGSLTTFNVMFKWDEDKFEGLKDV